MPCYPETYTTRYKQFNTREPRSRDDGMNPWRPRISSTICIPMYERQYNNRDHAGKSDDQKSQTSKPADASTRIDAGISTVFLATHIRGVWPRRTTSLSYPCTTGDSEKILSSSPSSRLQLGRHGLVVAKERRPLASRQPDPPRRMKNTTKVQREHGTANNNKGNRHHRCHDEAKTKHTAAGWRRPSTHRCYCIKVFDHLYTRAGMYHESDSIHSTP